MSEANWATLHCVLRLFSVSTSRYAREVWGGGDRASRCRYRRGVRRGREEQRGIEMYVKGRRGMERGIGRAIERANGRAMERGI